MVLACQTRPGFRLSGLSQRRLERPWSRTRDSYATLCYEFLLSWSGLPARPKRLILVYAWSTILGQGAPLTSSDAVQRPYPSLTTI
ncbi:hypothetical protein CALCODRAFT_47330 [Calocera cornea HHB12733]|uniref:Uncharacterized protein n=1 Tax=Calocera cornea HHB12733 TaxID=1353952 RepID=A0A165J0W5_9BASI|nr:hypothetical protein CALCODRAFT_47330 [Calocera cornea HHB12733]